MNNGIYLKEMGQRIKKARKAKGLFQHQLATLCDLHISAICCIERGQKNCHILTLKIMAEKLEIDVKDFL